MAEVVPVLEQAAQEFAGAAARSCFGPREMPSPEPMIRVTCAP